MYSWEHQPNSLGIIPEVFGKDLFLPTSQVLILWILNQIKNKQMVGGILTEDFGNDTQSARVILLKSLCAKTEGMIGKVFTPVVDGKCFQALGLRHHDWNLIYLQSNF